MDSILVSIGQALLAAFDMFWDVLWPLVLGFALSAIVQALVSHRTLARLLGDVSPRSLARATMFGIASSSCSYAAVALARSLFRKGASFTSAMVFEVASTNLVIELGVILFVLMGWQFTASEFLGGIVMAVLIALIFRLTLTPSLVRLARAHAERGALGRMEGHAAMDMSVEGGGPFLARLLSGRGFTAISHLFVMDWASVWQDILLGFLIAGALAAWVPNSFWQAFFLTGNPTLARIWRGGISFGGVVSFIFADLIVLPVLDIYRKYYGGRVALYILGTFYVTMAAAGYIVEIVFGALGIIPTNRTVGAIGTGPSWNYTAVLNIIFLTIAAALVVRFLRTGGPAMLRMMNTPEDEMAHHDHGMAGMGDSAMTHDMSAPGMDHPGHGGHAMHEHAGHDIQ
jgi:uncharacterized membrane protein YraQ (UPF0718 family)